MKILVKLSVLISVLGICAYSRGSYDRRSNLHRLNKEFPSSYSFKPRPYLVDVPETDEDLDFLSFVDFYEKGYQSQAEFALRREIYKRNMKLVRLAEQRIPKGSNLKLGPTRFADQTPLEMQQVFHYKSNGINQSFPLLRELLEAPINGTPKSFDWRNEGAVTPVKDQNGCGASWAYATASALESKFKIENGSLVILSTQQLIDCSFFDGFSPKGCETAADLTSVAQYVLQEATSIQSEQSYPDLNGRNGNTCNYNASLSVAKFQHYRIESTGNVDQIQVGIYLNGPLLAVAQVGFEFMFYDSGILDLDQTYFSQPHPLLIVGYGQSDQGSYWIGKNSFGVNWGENGYVRVKMERDGVDVLQLQQSVFTYYR